MNLGDTYRFVVIVYFFTGKIFAYVFSTALISPADHLQSLTGIRRNNISLTCTPRRSVWCLYEKCYAICLYTETNRKMDLNRIRHAQEEPTFKNLNE